MEVRRSLPATRGKDLRDCPSGQFSHILKLPSKAISPSADYDFRFLMLDIVLRLSAHQSHPEVCHVGQAKGN